jgi:transposase-like protein
MKRVFRIGREGKIKDVGLRGLWEQSAARDVDAKVAMIQALIPLGLQAVAESLEEEVVRLAGARYSRAGGRPEFARWGSQRGSVCLADQKLPIAVPRVRDVARRREVPLAVYGKLQVPRAADEGLFRKVLLGLSCRRYRESAEAVPEAFGLSPSSVSRRFIRASERSLRALCERRLSGEEFVAVVLDGKSFAGESMVVALGITLDGRKVPLGFVQTATENEKACAAFLRELQDRGLQANRGLLFVIDGSKGLRKAVQTVFGDKALVQRCQWHKRENVVSYLPRTQQGAWRKRLQGAYARPTYAEARAELLKLRRELALQNESAARSLDEGFEETLTLHRLGLFEKLGTSLKTTNCLESVNSQIARTTRRVGRWRNSNQKQRFLAAALLDIEPRLRRIKGRRHLPLLQAALEKETSEYEQKVA